MAQLLQPKQQLAGYEIGELVGRGGMGEVYRARQISMDRMVALKILAPRLVKQDPIFAKRFVDEARAAGRLNHPNIIAVHDVGKAAMPGVRPGSEPALEYFSMEFVDGESVKDIIERQGITPLSVVAQVMHGMTEALVYAEAQGIVHRDIKPDNIMITNDGQVKLADLGLALQLGGEEVVGEKDEQGRSKVMGTPLYMSPEQARALPVDSRSDQYSLGATLFHMLSGSPPYTGENAKVIMRAHVFDPVPDPKALNSEVPEGWRQLCMRLMAKSPEERFQNALAMRAALQAAISGGGLGILRRARTSSFSNTKDRVSALPPWVKFLIFGLGGAVAVMVVVFAIPWGDSANKDSKTSEDLVVKADSHVEAQKLLERVRGLISALPADHEKAIAQIDELSQDKTIPVGPTRDLLDRERAARVTSLNEQKRRETERLLAEKARERQARTIELEQAFAANDLPKVKECLDYLSAETEKLSPSMRERLATIKVAFGVALVDQQKVFSDEIIQAVSADELNAIRARVKASPQSDEVKQLLRKSLVKRAAEIAPPKQQQAVDESAQWRAFIARVEELRGGRTYGEITKLPEHASAAFTTNESKAVVQNIAKLGRLAMRAEGALRVYVQESKPVVDIVFNGKASKAKLLSIDDMVDFILQDGNGDGEMRHDRRDLGLPLRQIMEQALEDSRAPAAERPAMVAAMLWVWRHADAAAVFSTMTNSPLAQAVAELDQRMRVSDGLEAKISRNGDTATVTYDGSKANPWLLADFVGEGAQITPGGLEWVAKSVVHAKGPESALPTLRWKQGLRPPFSLTAQVQVQPKTYLLLLGVSSGERTVRIGFNNSKGPMAAVVVVTKPDGVGFEQLKARNTAGDLTVVSMNSPFKTDGPQKVDIRVDADYRVSLRFNDTKLVDSEKLSEGPITPVIQAINLKEGDQVSTVISALTISGNLPQAE